MEDTERTRPDRETRAAERDEAELPASAGAEPSDDESAAAEAAARALDAEQRAAVGEHYREMTGRGAHQDGEGRVP